MGGSIFSNAKKGDQILSLFINFVFGCPANPFRTSEEFTTSFAKRLFSQK